MVRLNCCSRYFPRKAAKPATTAISMQAANATHVNTGLDSRKRVTRGMTETGRERERGRVWEWEREGSSGRERERERERVG